MKSASTPDLSSLAKRLVALLIFHERVTTNLCILLEKLSLSDAFCLKNLRLQHKEPPKSARQKRRHTTSRFFEAKTPPQRKRRKVAMTSALSSDSEGNVTEDEEWKGPRSSSNSQHNSPLSVSLVRSHTADNTSSVHRVTPVETHVQRVLFNSLFQERVCVENA